jgi:hypothetical protein
MCCTNNENCSQETSANECYIYEHIVHLTRLEHKSASIYTQATSRVNKWAGRQSTLFLPRSNCTNV